MYLSSFINRFRGEVYPEFPTGNGKIDLIIKYEAAFKDRETEVRVEPIFVEIGQ